MLNFNKANSEECKYYCMNLGRKKNVLKDDYTKNDKNSSRMYGKMLPMKKEKRKKHSLLTSLLAWYLVIMSFFFLKSSSAFLMHLEQNPKSLVWPAKSWALAPADISSCISHLSCLSLGSKHIGLSTGFLRHRGPSFLRAFCRYFTFFWHGPPAPDLVPASPSYISPHSPQKTFPDPSFHLN